MDTITLPAPHNPISGTLYQGKNAAILHGVSQRYGSAEFATFLQWKKAGYMVRKGEKAAAYIFKFVEYDEKTKMKDGTTKVRTAHAPRCYAVFNRAQVEQLKDPTCILCDAEEEHEH